jgi:hypothetical protein
MAGPAQVIEVKEVGRISPMLLDVHFRPHNVIHIHAESAPFAQDGNLAERIPR